MSDPESVNYERKRQHMNTNPTLIMGLATAYAIHDTLATTGAPIHPAERDRLSVRVYPDDTSGFYFVTARNAGRWYWITHAGADHYTRADVNRVEETIKSGGRVQITGGRGRSYGVWSTWGEFEAAMTGGE